MQFVRSRVLNCCNMVANVWNIVLFLLLSIASLVPFSRPSKNHLVKQKRCILLCFFQRLVLIIGAILSYLSPKMCFFLTVLSPNNRDLWKSATVLSKYWRHDCNEHDSLTISGRFCEVLQLDAETKKFPTFAQASRKFQLGP